MNLNNLFPDDSNKPINEVSLGDYVKKAGMSKALSQMGAAFAPSPEQREKELATAKKREKGLARAKSRTDKIQQARMAQQEKDHREQEKQRLPELEARLKKLQAEFDPQYDYSDDHSYWSHQRGIAAEISMLKRRISQAKGLDESADQDSRYVQAARDVLKGAEFDHIARVRGLDAGTLKQYVAQAQEKLRTGEYKINRPNLEEEPYEYRPPGASAAQVRQVMKKINQPGSTKFVWKRPNQISGSHTEQDLRSKGFRWSDKHRVWGGTQEMWSRLTEAEPMRFKDFVEKFDRLHELMRQADMANNKEQYEKLRQQYLDLERRARQGMISEVSDETLISYLTKIDADARKHQMDPTKRDPRKASKSIGGFSRAFNKLDARKDVRQAQTLAPRVSEGVSIPEGRPALGRWNIGVLMDSYKKNYPYAEMSFGTSGDLRVDRKQMRFLLEYYKKLPNQEAKFDYVYETLSRLSKVVALFDKETDWDIRPQIILQPGQVSTIPGTQAGLFELADGASGDARLARALKQARAEFPTAKTDIEAFLKKVMSNDDRDLEAIRNIQSSDRRQSELLQQIQAADQAQSDEIDDLETQLAKVDQTNSELERQLGKVKDRPAIKQPEKEKEKPAVKAKDKEPAAPELPAGTDTAPSPARAKPAAKQQPTLPRPAEPLKIGQAASNVIDFDPRQRNLFKARKQDVVDVEPRTPAPASADADADADNLDNVLDITDIEKDLGNNGYAEPKRAAAESAKKPSKETDYDDPRWDAMVRRVGQRAKQGPLKTVWDPEKRVYKNVPVNPPKSVNEARQQRKALLEKILKS